MRCRRFFISSLVVLLGVFFGSFIINQNQKVSALDDLVFTTGSGGSPVCTDCYNLGYRYVIVNIPTVSSNSQYISILISYPAPSAFNSTNRIGTVGTTIFVLHDSASINSLSYQNSVSGTVTISDHLPSSLIPSSPSGSLSITENGSYDVTNYAEAVVNVESEVIQGDYHNDLISINQSILICAGVCLVIYFFYCIYRMIIKTTGGN